MSLPGLAATGICSMLGAAINVIPFMIQRSVPGIGPFVLPAYLLAALPALFAAIRQGASAEMLERDIDAGSRRLLELVGGADGCQHTSDRLVGTRHLSNTLFNIMRGGVYSSNYLLERDDLIDYIAQCNQDILNENRNFLEDINKILHADFAVLIHIR